MLKYVSLEKFSKLRVGTALTQSKSITVKSLLRKQCRVLLEGRVIMVYKPWWERCDILYQHHIHEIWKKSKMS